ncbi:MAG: hypothetical protein ACOH2T_29220 [Pseudomonas sp.]
MAILAQPDTFFRHVRAHLFGGHMAQSQVDGINAILAAWAKYGDSNLQRLSYVLATPNVETGGAYQPVYEYGPRSYFNKYEPGTKLGKQLGNTVKGDGYRFRGTGMVQSTGRANAVRAGKKLGLDLVGNPELMMDLGVSAQILVVGTLEGWFTGKGLAAYIDDADESDDEDLKEFIQARRTVNGQDKALVIGKDALIFEAALKAGGYGKTPPAPAAPAKPAPAPTATKPHKSPLAAIVGVLIAIGAAAVAYLKSKGIL